MHTAVYNALQSAQTSDLRHFCMDQGVDIQGCIEPGDLIAQALPKLIEMGTSAVQPLRARPGASASSPRHTAFTRRLAPDRRAKHLAICTLCGEPIRLGQSAMRFEASSWRAPHQQLRRDKQEKVCHATCMRCNEGGCGHTDKLQLGKDGRVYCRKHYDLRYLPHCTACGEPIRDSFVTAMKGQKYHPHCFVCSGCQQQLSDGDGRRAGKYVIGDDGLPYCERDYKRLFAPRCAACAIPMTTWVELESPLGAITFTDSTNGVAVKMCRRCASEAPSCFSCRSMQTSSSHGTRFTDLPDGRIVCSACNST